MRCDVEAKSRSECLSADTSRTGNRRHGHERLADCPHPFCLIGRVKASLNYSSERSTLRARTMKRFGAGPT